MASPLDLVPKPLDRVAGALTNSAWVASQLASSGILAPIRPDRAVRLARTLIRWGTSPATGYTAGAIRHPDRVAFVDELGSLTFRQLDERTNALARAFSRHGVRTGDNIAILCRNHRGWVEATVAAGKLGAHGLFLNTGFAAPQVAEVLQHEGAVAVVYDEEFRDLIEGAEGRRRYVAWRDGEARPGEEALEDLIAGGDPAPLEPPAEKGRTVILTSGTTGTPKGANRSAPASLDPVASLLSKIPLHARETTVIAAPLFHSWGMAHWSLGLALSSTAVVRRRFDPEATLAMVAENRASALVVVPVMLQRILELDPAVLDRYNTSSLKVIAVSGSALSGDLARRGIDRFGEVVYNLYGSTEVAWATIATPEDLRAAPGTAGKAPRGTIVKIYDEAGHELPIGQTGRIFVGNEFLFEGYTGGQSKARIGALMSSGDVGHLDAEGRLFVEGRDDDMIVSGGENVFPAEVEDCIAAHPDVREAAVIGVRDPEWGQRLRAYVVGDVSADEIRSHVKANLANYKVPRDVEFLDELPRNATGKVVKRHLPEVGDRAGT